MSIVTSTNILGRMATQQYAEKTGAHSEHYTLEPVYYASLEEARRAVARRCAARTGGSPAAAR